MNIDFDIAGSAAAAPDYRTLRTLIVVHARPNLVRPAPLPRPAGAESCRFSRIGIARLFGWEEQGKDVLNLHGSKFGEPGGVGTSQKPSDPVIGSESVQGAYA